MSNRTILVLFIVFSLISTLVEASGAAAGGGAAASASIQDEQNLQKQQRTNGCIPPLKFASENECSLNYAYRDYRVNSYDCYYDKYRYSHIVSDCDGDIIQRQDYDNSPKGYAWVILGFFVVSVIVFAILEFGWFRKDA